ncbi:unnamed protein product [Sphacelaria rigidula]
MDTNVFMKLPDGCAPLMAYTVRLEKSIYIYGVKQAEGNSPSSSINL